MNNMKSVIRKKKEFSTIIREACTWNSWYCEHELYDMFELHENVYWVT